MEISKTLKAYVYLERAAFEMDAVNDAWASEIRGLMDSLWNDLSSGEMSWLNSRNFTTDDLKCPCEL